MIDMKNPKFARPGYQNDTVNNYLAGLPEGLYEGYYNP